MGSTVFGYNNIGQLYTYTFPDGLRVRYNYNNFGELSNIYDDSNNTLICAIGRNNFRKHSGLAFSNQTGIKYLYNAYGMLTDISSGDIEVGSQLNEIGGDKQNNSTEGSPSSIGDQYRALKYSYNAKGLIERREDTRVNQYETYVYDNLDRLTSYTSGTIQPISANTVTYGINSLGNITSNTQVGNYSYGAKPFAVELINYFTNCTISHSTCSTPFNNRNLPASITEGIYSYSIDYGSDGYRRSAVLNKTENGVNKVIKTTRYVSPACEIEITPTGTKFIDYIFTDQGVAAIRTKEDTKLNMYYVHTDHLGSYNFVMDADKNVVQSCHFDPWGNRKLYNNWSQNNTATSFQFSRGYTSHEHLDVFKIINMNARLYDPIIGRFFSPDPVIQDFEATQSLNRYSYCQNNPVNRIDPDGKVDSEYKTKYVDENGHILLNTNDGNNSTFRVENDKKWTFYLKYQEMKKNGKLNDKQSNVELIDAVTSASDGLFFTDKQMAWMYINNNTIENVAWSVQGGVVVEPTVGIDIFTGINESNSDGNGYCYLKQTQIGNSLFVSLNNADFKVNSFIHDHPGREGWMDQANKFSGTTYGGPKYYQGDYGFFQLNYTDKGISINMYLIGPTDVVQGPYPQRNVLGSSFDLRRGINLIK